MDTFMNACMSFQGQENRVLSIIKMCGHVKETVMSFSVLPASIVNSVLLLHVAATFFMLGLIWFVQVVHYPLMAGVGLEGFASYAQQHAGLTTLVVAPAMLLEASTGFALALNPPSHSTPWLWWVGLLLLGVIWLSTALLSVPRHHQLQQGFQANLHQALVLGNWVRTIAWSVRSAGLLYILQGLLSGVKA
jgi:hypothetical protein